MRQKILVAGIALLLLGIILLDCLARYSANLPFLITAQNNYNFTVPAWTTQPVTLHLIKGDRLKGQFTIVGGERNDIAFQVEDPLGNKFVDIYRIYDMFCYLDFTATMNGDYNLYFDNTFSENSDKHMTLTTEVISTRRLLFANILATLLATIGVCLCIVGVVLKPEQNYPSRTRVDKERVLAFDINEANVCTTLIRCMIQIQGRLS